LRRASPRDRPLRLDMDILLCGWDTKPVHHIRGMSLTSTTPGVTSGPQFFRRVAVTADADRHHLAHGTKSSEVTTACFSTPEELASHLGKNTGQPVTVNVADAALPLWRPLAWKVSRRPG
jgi:hypothetical protein